MKRIAFLLFVVSMMAVSCKRQPGSTTACFNISKTPAKVNDTLYLLNCSLNYDKVRWFIPSYLYIDTVNRHLKFVPTGAGNMDVYLWVAMNDTTKQNMIKKTISVQ